jgi:hypothetical protein
MAMSGVRLLPERVEPLLQELGYDAFGARIAARAARLPPGAAATAPADLRVQVELFTLFRAAAETFAAPAADAKALATAALDFMRATALREVVGGAAVYRIGAAPALLAAAGAAVGAELPEADGAAPERDLLLAALLLSQTLMAVAVAERNEGNGGVKEWLRALDGACRRGAAVSARRRAARSSASRAGRAPRTLRAS